MYLKFQWLVGLQLLHFKFRDIVKSVAKTGEKINRILASRLLVIVISCVIWNLKYGG